MDRISGDAHYQLAVGLAMTGWPELGLSHALLSQEDYTALGRPYGRVMAYSAIAMSYYFLGEYQLAQVTARTGIELAERTQGWRMLGYLYSYLAIATIATGQMDIALQNAEQSIEIADRGGYNEISALGRRIVGDVFALLGDYPRALMHYLSAYDVSRGGLAAPDSMLHVGAAFFPAWKV